jgi:hypothetical protein
MLKHLAIHCWLYNKLSGECQCLEGSLNAYLDKCLDVIKFNFDEFCIHHIPRHENCLVNDLAKWASGYNVQSKNFHVEAKPMLGSEEIMFYTEPEGLTATSAGLTATQTGQITTQASPIARTQVVAVLRSWNRNMLKKIGGSRLLIICEIQARRSTKVFVVLLSSLL